MASSLYHPYKLATWPYSALNVAFYVTVLIAAVSFITCHSTVYTIIYAAVALLCDLLHLLHCGKRGSFYRQALCASLIVFLAANILLLFVK